ncbi:MAG: manganese-dependent inorganic pyrophosphatase [Sulfurimonas sp.]|uniref:manganese-dependent inorganic pyrophosphatase n=1 Tax=Sulfurimonas sp. TaxID=2022749 RepID=UPI0025D22A6B|nr:manganese-dependent inorganic pyrophosphatase [Sulfurimonas sp.]MCK9492333.1 manganese-dependent inorganic pyrophosphatase [Sulfurimonas sp.]
MSTYIFGHTNPDSDSIVGAISLAYLKNKLGENCVATRQGEISPETEFILNKFGGSVPELKTSYAGESVYLVDFSDLAQAPKDIMEATILGIYDHHKLGDITTSTPLECWIRPIGCSNTVIKEAYDYHGVDIPKDIAGMMMCAILSDTVIFKSPTCTKIDTKAVKELAKIAGIEDYKALGMEMFIVKSAVEGASARELNTRDYKEFVMGSDKLGIGQLEVVDLSVFDNIKADLFLDMKKLKEENGLHSVIILLTDIMKEGSQMLVISDDNSKVERAFKCKLENSEAWLDGVLSRKKQVIPFLQAQF